MKNTLRKHAPLLVIAAALLLTHCSCDFFGTTGAILIPESKEMQLGASFDSNLVYTDSGQKHFPIFKPKNAQETAFRDYVLEVANSVLAAVPSDQRPGYPFKFTLIDDTIQNAFAVPGGYVYIYAGIIKTMKDESELAGVLGHEIAHVTQHHYRDLMAKSAAFGLLIDVLLGNDSQLGQTVGGALFSMAAIRMTSSNEAEADEFGTRYTGLSHRNPLGIAKYFSRIEDQPLAWFQNHPPPSDRVEAVTKEVEGDATLKAIAADSANTNYKAQFCAKMLAPGCN